MNISIDVRMQLVPGSNVISYNRADLEGQRAANSTARNANRVYCWGMLYLGILKGMGGSGAG